MSAGANQVHTEGAGRIANGLRVRKAAIALWLSVALVSGLLVSRILSPILRQEEAGAADTSTPTVTYSLWVRNDASQPHINVSLQIPVPKGDRSVTIQMPAWSPGDYKIQNHGRYVE